MVALTYGIGAFKRTAGRLPEVKLVNMYVEQVPEGESPVVLIPRPALVASYTVGNGPIWGIYTQPGTFSGAIVSLSGDTLYSGSTALGTIPGAMPATFASDDAQLLVANGVALYRSTGASVATVSFPDSAAVQDVAYLNGYFLASRLGTGKIYFSAIGDGSSFDGLDFFTAERRPDNVLALRVVGDRLWAVGENSTQGFYRTGDADLPFAPTDGSSFDKGTKARDTVCLFDNTLAWVSDDGLVVMLRGNDLVRVSNYGIEERIAQSAASELRAFALTFQGHAFYILRTAQGTYAYDASTGQWAQFSTYGRTTWRAHVGCMAGDVVYVGDDTTGKIYRLSDNVAEDDGVTIERMFSANVPLSGQPVRCDTISLDVSVGQTDILTGLGTAPVVEKRFSRDAGNIYTEWRQSSLGAQGAYRTRVAWLRNGIIDEPGRVMQFRMTDPVPFRMSSLRMNERGGGLSR